VLPGQCAAGVVAHQSVSGTVVPSAFCWRRRMPMGGLGRRQWQSERGEVQKKVASHRCVASLHMTRPDRCHCCCDIVVASNGRAVPPLPTFVSLCSSPFCALSIHSASFRHSATYLFAEYLPSGVGGLRKGRMRNLTSDSNLKAATVVEAQSKNTSCENFVVLGKM